MNDADPVAWKIARDPYLGAVAERWGAAAAWEAGFFADADPADAPLDDVGWLSTPTAAVRRGLRDVAGEGSAVDPAPVVLVATGAFWPPHHGHVAMMEAARRALEAQGTPVVAGYLSPGHDEYLRLKWGDVAPPASARVAALWDHVADHEWLAVDPWEATARRTSVNYTDVTARLGRYLRAQVDARIEVAYVCGGDNARFALAFALDGRCVVVGRPGTEAEVARRRADPRLADAEAAGRVVWADGDVDAASSRLDPPSWASTRPTLRLRCEDRRAVARVGLDETTWRSFQRALAERLSTVVDVAVVAAEDQPGAGLRPDDPARPLLSLDPMVPGTVDVGVSRCFDLGGGVLVGRVARPGRPPLADQLAALAPGRWTVLEDDRMTGDTVRHVLAALPAGVEVVDVVLGMADGVAGEIADSRDLLVGTDDGGLVVELPDGSVGRVPYLLPYVDPALRGVVPPEDAVTFSRDLWAANAELFAGTGHTVADLEAAQQRPFVLAGFAPSDTLAAVCAHHVAVVERWCLSPTGRTVRRAGRGTADPA